VVLIKAVEEGIKGPPRGTVVGELGSAESVHLVAVDVRSCLR
jgi:hypothetical protein